MREPNYTYSRDFGVPFSGAGVGLLKSRVYLAMHDATIQIGGRAGNADGALVRVSFQNSVDEVLQWMINWTNKKRRKQYMYTTYSKPS